MGKQLLVATLLAAAGTANALEHGALPHGTEVRLTSAWVELGTWHTGVVDTSNGCTAVKLAAPAAGGYDQVTLLAIGRMQRADSGSWSEVAVREWLASEPAQCRFGRAD